MSRFTGGIIAATPMKLKTPGVRTLEDMLAASLRLRYDGEASKASAGWGSSLDDDSVIDEQVISRLTVGEPAIIPAAGVLPRRLRLRYYWDQLSKPLLKTLGANAEWRRTHVRRAIDVIVFDDETDSGRSVLVSTRDAKQLTTFAVPAVRELGQEVDAGATVQSNNINESLDPDFFTWLLYRLQDSDPLVGDKVRLDKISEISSRDRLLRGAKFTEQATFERIELAALITLGKTRFGPAKMGLNVEDLDAYYYLELHLDGGFNVYRTTEYDSADPIPAHLAGHVFSEDLWSIVLPRLRDQFNSDSHWRETGRNELTNLAVQAIRAILPDPDPDPAGASPDLR